MEDREVWGARSCRRGRGSQHEISQKQHEISQKIVYIYVMHAMLVRASNPNLILNVRNMFPCNDVLPVAHKQNRSIGAL